MYKYISNFELLSSKMSEDYNFLYAPCICWFVCDIVFLHLVDLTCAPGYSDGCWVEEHDCDIFWHARYASH